MIYGALERLAKTLHLLSALVAIPAMVIAVSADVGLRYFFSSPIRGGGEITGLMLLVAFIFAVPYCTAQKRQIHIDLLYSRLTNRAKSLIDIISAFTGLVVAGFLVWQAAWDVGEMIEFQTAGQVSGIPFWPFSVLLALTGLLLLSHFALELVVRIAELGRGAGGT